MSKTKNAAIEREQNQTRLSSAEREQSRPQGNVVIDDQNKKNEKQQQMNNRRRDINRLTKETNYKLFDALTKAMSQVQGNRKTGEAICDSEIYCDMWALQSAAFARVVKHDRKLQQYEDMETGELLHQLYQRLQTLHHGRELPGIAWTESDGRFVIQLRDCAINMEHTITDEARLPGWNDDITKLEGTLYAIGYDPDIDCDDPDGDCYQHYEEALNFLCELNIHEPDNTEHRDVIIYHRSWQHREVLRDTLASLDLIADMANENNNKNV